MSLLFQPIKFSSLQLNNRMIIAPMCQYSATTEGEPTFWHAQQWANFALSGAGLTIIEATAVQAVGRISYADLGLWNDQQRDKIKTMLADVKNNTSNALFAVQLAHAGRKASSIKPWHGGGQLPPNHEDGWQTVSASTLPFNPENTIPHALTLPEIEQLKQDFASAAVRAVEAGFDLIEIHAAHGYLLHQFLSPLSNLRQDEYGGSLENRLRLTLEVVDAIKQAVPQDYPVGIRISATDWVEGGWDLASSIVLAKLLDAMGVAYIHVSTAGLHPEQKIDIKPNYQVPFAEAIKAEVKTPVIAVGLITEPKQAEQILQDGQADAIGIARAILYQPRWPWQAAVELGETIGIAPQYLRCAPHGQHAHFINIEDDALDA